MRVRRPTTAATAPCGVPSPAGARWGRGMAKDAKYVCRWVLPERGGGWAMTAWQCASEVDTGLYMGLQWNGLGFEGGMGFPRAPGCCCGVTRGATLDVALPTTARWPNQPPPPPQKKYGWLKRRWY